jgi:sorbitol/mannitol transport system permease protein
MSRAQLTVAERQTKPLTRLILGVLTWVIILIFFFPVFWMAITGFKT